MSGGAVAKRWRWKMLGMVAAHDSAQDEQMQVLRVQQKRSVCMLLRSTSSFLKSKATCILTSDERFK